MQDSLTIFLVDSFIGHGAKGNPAGICLVDRFPSDITMQEIAAELNWSATAFIVQKSPQHFSIRCFSPKDESPLSGHAILAAAHLLQEENKIACDFISFDTYSGPITALFSPKGITLDLPSKKVFSCAMPDIMIPALGDVRICSVNRDENTYLVLVEDEKTLRTLKPNFSYIEKMDCRAIIITTYGGNGYDFSFRYFAPRVGVFENSACGSAHCLLVPFWAEESGKKSLLAYQFSPRKGLFSLELKGERVLITGKAQLAAIGKFYLASLASWRQKLSQKD